MSYSHHSSVVNKNVRNEKKFMFPSKTVKKSISKNSKKNHSKNVENILNYHIDMQKIRVLRKMR